MSTSPVVHPLHFSKQSTEDIRLLLQNLSSRP
jgi:hypothetical protein